MLYQLLAGRMGILIKTTVRRNTMKHIMPFGRLDTKKPDNNKNTLTIYSLPDWQYFSIIHWYVSSREHSHTTLQVLK